MTRNKWSWLTDLPTSDLPGKQKFLKIVAVLALCVCVPMSAYWGLVHDNPIRCIFGDSECSLTVSTYLLDSLTALVFAATLIAAMFAKAAFEHERHSGISVHQCSGTKSCGLHGSRDLYYDDDGKRFTTTTPRAFDKDTWGVANIDCIGVGKSPLIGCELQVAFGKATEDDQQKFIGYPIRIASMRADGEAHIHLHFSRTHAEEKVFVRAAWQQISGDFRFYLVDPVLDIGDFGFDKAAAKKETEENVPPVLPPPLRPVGLPDPPPLQSDEDVEIAALEDGPDTNEDVAEPGVPSTLSKRVEAAKADREEHLAAAATVMPQAPRVVDDGRSPDSESVKHEAGESAAPALDADPKQPCEGPRTGTT